jgi:hypothetical protein
MAFSLADAALIASRGKATSISFFGEMIGWSISIVTLLSGANR